MKIVYLGNGEFGIECLNALGRSSGSTELAEVHSLRFIVTQLPHPAGRGRKPRPTPVARWANTHSIPFIEIEDVNATEVIEKVARYEPDLIVVIAFGQKIANELINLPPFLLSQESTGAINVHASLLPKYRGAAPINWTIINGESQTGISIIGLTEEMDAGPICAQAKTEVLADETASQLHDRLAKMAAPLLVETIDKIADGSIVYTEQDRSKATFAPKLKKSDGFLDFADSAKSIRRKILGFWPWPGASAIYASKNAQKPLRVTIAMAEVVEISNPAGSPAGTLDENLNVICGTAGLKITKIKPDGSRLMNFEDFVNGRQTRPGDMLVKIE